MTKALRACLTALIITVVTSSYAGSARAANSCIGLFAPLSISLTPIASKLQVEMAHLKETISGLEINGKDLRPGERIGHGVSGVVIRVTRQTPGSVKNYALKILAETDLQERTESVVIQNAFADLGLAPRVYGVMSPSETQAWMSKHGLEFPDRFSNSRVDGAILMELTSTHSFKENTKDRALVVTPAYRDQLLREANILEQVAARLGIYPGDVDVVANARGHLELIDFGFLSYKPDPSLNHRWTDQIERLVERGTRLAP